MGSRQHEKKVFNSLINACKIALGAESGSVMTINKFKQTRTTAAFGHNKDKADISYRKDPEFSITVPFNNKNTRELHGVLNLSIVRKSKEFSENDILLAKELVNLASIALYSCPTG